MAGTTKHPTVMVHACAHRNREKVPYTATRRCPQCWLTEDQIAADLKVREDLTPEQYRLYRTLQDTTTQMRRMDDEMAEIQQAHEFWTREWRIAADRFWASMGWI